MDKPLITSTGNSLVKHVRALRQKKARAETGLFLVEGIHHVGEAAEAGWEIESLLYAPDLLTGEFARDLIASLSPHAQPVSVRVMVSLAGKENPQGILAVVHQKGVQPADIDIQAASVALVSPQDPGNLGAILRTMDATGVEAMFLLDGGVEVFHPTAVRSSMGTIFWKPIVATSFDEFVTWARSRGHQLIGTSAHADVGYRSLIPREPWVLILGNEQKGLSADQANACDVTVSLPMAGRVSSLNLAVAAGVLLYTLKS